MDITKRNNLNPILKPCDFVPAIEGMEIACLLNPGVFMMDGRVGLVIRVAERPKQIDGKISFPIYTRTTPISMLQILELSNIKVRII